MYKKTVSWIAIVLSFSFLISFVSSCSSSEGQTADDLPESKEISYRFTGYEAERPGYAEGEILYTPEEPIMEGEYVAYFGNESGILENHYAISSEVVEETEETLTLEIGENIFIPKEADRIIIRQRYAEDDETDIIEVGIPKKKRYSESPKMVFASVSDIHLNYDSGEKFWLNCLNQYEELGAQYIVTSGDVSSDGSHYKKYTETTEESDYTGLIFNCIGNHEQTKSGEASFFSNAIYDGDSKTWISLDEAEDYFRNTYKGPLDVHVYWEDLEENVTDYYYITVADNLFFFMDQMLKVTGETPDTDNFSDAQLELLENTLRTFSSTHKTGNEFDYESYNLYIVEHAPVHNLSSGDLFDGIYVQPLLMKEEYPRVMKFVDLIKEYDEVIWLSGHSHLGFDESVDYVDRVYDANGDLTEESMARSVHNSSVSQPRWYQDGKIIYASGYCPASEGYLCYQYENDIVFEGHRFKEYDESIRTYDSSLFGDKIVSRASFIMPKMVLSH